MAMIEGFSPAMNVLAIGALHMTDVDAKEAPIVQLQQAIILGIMIAVHSPSLAGAIVEELPPSYQKQERTDATQMGELYQRMLDGTE